MCYTNPGFTYLLTYLVREWIETPSEFQRSLFKSSNEKEYSDFKERSSADFL